MKRLLFILFAVVVVPIAVYHLVNGGAATDSSTLNEQNAGQPDDQAGQEQQDERARQVASANPDQQVAGLIQNEKLIRAVGPQLATLNELVMNLDLRPDYDANVFLPDARIREIGEISSDTVSERSSVLNIRVDLGKELEFSKQESVWPTLLNQVDYFANAKFYAVRVNDRTFLPESFSVKTAFDALARTRSGKWWAIQAVGEIKWRSVGEKWKIAELDFNEFTVRQTDQLLFEDATAKCFNDTDRIAVERSAHFEKILKILSEGTSAYDDERQRKYFPHIATGRHPSVSVVDVDQDGWDDLYVVEQWRKNMLFRNNHDGTFTESAASYGLDIKGYGTSAMFGDFDNDGDQDLFLGRSLRRSQLFENENGKFVDRTADWFGFDLPFLVSTVSATDFNNDGLLDLYVGTYGILAAGQRPAQWIREFVAPEQRQYVLNLFRSFEFNRYTNAAGPANFLFENVGGKFRISDFSESVATYKNTLQATWSDYDSDGDQDLYVANDFARDYLYRNDREQGFKDVTLEFGDDTMMGFGMGASWGDYDLDGKQDLYVSNMYSKAGIRIVEHFDGLDPKFRRSADGNRLYRNFGDGLKLVSANEGEGANVHKAGWSWGGQFADLNNDGYLDIYVTAGYFTAPDIYDTHKDL